jgi:2-amino-4-hydroxy-6-hydroxymethyldihydropteridine diphosphokinase|tara:strand:+ start:64 stop:567 length:504 start_codon:yes stop_codon:yes gene_type:complete
MNKVYLSIGSNLGDKESNIASCIAMLSSTIEITNIKTSSFYLTEPLFNTNQPSFLNIILEHETSLSPFQLLDRIQDIEKILGREKKREKNQPRTIDIDIIIFKNTFIETSELQIPHPGSLNRKFVLIPLSELIPNEFFPKTNIKIVDLLKKCSDTSVVEKYMIDKKA